jgi:hypothetical protein
VDAAVVVKLGVHRHLEDIGHGSLPIGFERYQVRRNVESVAAPRSTHRCHRAGNGNLQTSGRAHAKRARPPCKVRDPRDGVWPGLR